MAELGLSTSSSTIDTVVSIANEGDVSRNDPPVDEIEGGEPSPKKARYDGPPVQNSYCLEDRLNGILCCTVCLDLPTVAMFQCVNGHLMCAGCHAHLIADSRLRDENATCPNCRCDIRENSCVRNLAVEKALSELPTECIFCQGKFPRNQIENHQKSVCKERISGCRYERIGCTWKGPFHELSAHESECVLPKKPGSELIDSITAIDAKSYGELTLFRNIFDLLSFQKIAQSDPQLKPYRTDDFVTKLFYESARFSALGCQWVLKATVSEEVKDPTMVSERNINYSLILKGRSSNALDVHYLVLRGPHSNFKIKPAIYRHEFTAEATEAPSRRLLVEDSIECNRILSHRVINLRVLMFQSYISCGNSGYSSNRYSSASSSNSDSSY